MKTILMTLMLAACTGSGQVSYSGDVQTPQLVEVSPGVQVIADANEPIFYSDSYYWRNDNGVWLRSRDHRTGWARVEIVPTPIRSIDRPSMYVHYRGQARTHVVQGPAIVPETRHEEHELNKERAKDVKEERKDMKEERKDAKEQRKEDKELRKEMKHERDD